MASTLPRGSRLAEPTGIVISGTAYDHVKNKLAVGFEFRGKQRVKNVAEPVRVYRIALDGTPARRLPLGRFKRRGWLWGAGAAAVLAAAGGFAMWQSPGALWQSIGGAQPSAVADDVLALPSGPSIAVLLRQPLGRSESGIFRRRDHQDLITVAHYKNFWSTPATPVPIQGQACRYRHLCQATRRRLRGRGQRPATGGLGPHQRPVAGCPYRLRLEQLV